MSSRSKLTSLNVSNTLTCVLQPFDACWHTQHLYWQPALTCVLQRLSSLCPVRKYPGNPHSHAYCNQAHCEPVRKGDTGNPHSHAYCNLANTQSTNALNHWQPALTCVLQRQKCTILQHAEFVNAGLFVHGYLLSLGLKKSRRVGTEYRSEKHFLLRILSAKIRVCIS